MVKYTEALKYVFETTIIHESGSLHVILKVLDH